MATLDDLRELLAEVDIDLSDVARGGLIVDFVPPAKLCMVVVTYARDANGKRYLSTMTGEVATEGRRFFITKDWHLVKDPVGVLEEVAL